MQNCEICGSPQVELSRFCGNCGHALTAATAGFTALSDYHSEASVASAGGPASQVAVDDDSNSTSKLPDKMRQVTPVPDEYETRSYEMMADLPFLSAGAPQSSGNMPVVAGTPQLPGNMPVVGNTPPLPQGSVMHPSFGPAAGQMPPSLTPGGAGVQPSFGQVGQFPPGSLPGGGASQMPSLPQGPTSGEGIYHPSLGPHVGQPAGLTPGGAGVHPSFGQVGQMPQGASLPQLPSTPGGPISHPSLGPHFGQMPAGQGVSGTWPAGPHSGLMPTQPGGTMPVESAHAYFTAPHTAVSAAAKTAKAGKLLAKPLLHQLWFWLTIPVALVVVAAGALGTVYVFIPASLGLVNGSQTVMSGLTMQVHGSHFVPGGEVTLKLDNQQTVRPVTVISVSGQGEFDALIDGTENWSLGKHTIHASESTLARDAVFNFALLGNSSTVTPSVTSFDTSTGACQYVAGTGWSCPISLSIQGGQGKVHWSASSTGISGVTFAPSSGILASGQTQTITATVPDMVCPASASFLISGWANPLHIAWSCIAPTLAITGVLCPITGGYYVCPVPIALAANSQGMANWTVTSPSPGVIIQPGSGTLSIGQSQTINLSIPQSECRTAQFVFTVVGGQSQTIGLDTSRCP
ncbi:MAG TPA: hypothetical protein VGD98_06645 [Ktedonobacteraceae bacterium]